MRSIRSIETARNKFSRVSYVSFYLLRLRHILDGFLIEEFLGLLDEDAGRIVVVAPLSVRQPEQQQQEQRPR